MARPVKKAVRKFMSPSEIAVAFGTLEEGDIVELEVLRLRTSEEANGDLEWEYPFKIIGALEKNDGTMFVGPYYIRVDDWNGAKFTETLKSVTVVTRADLPDDTVIRDGYGGMWVKQNGIFRSPGGGEADFESIYEPVVLYRPKEEEEDDDE
jgi:hypothetical protein